MKLSLDQAAVLASIEENVPSGARLYFLDAFTREGAGAGGERRIRADIATAFVASRDFAPPEAEFYVYSPRSIDLAPYGTVTELGPGLWRVARRMRGAS